ncbi:hypothetical protein [Herbaspirillum sp. NPDC101397]|uniref:hypothetical protein n=1 Tax=Herbaspirillum sp. NPDC101397 TaxID=3364006 RepID=UPI00383B944E
MRSEISGGYFSWKNYLLPLFFLIIAFSWPMQVLSQSALVGGGAYLLLVLTGALLFRGETERFIQKGSYSWIDIALLLVGGVVLIHSILHALLIQESAFYQLKWLIIFGGAGYVYFYTSRYATEAAIKATLASIFLIAIFFSLYWIYESYLKTVLQQTHWYANSAFDYIRSRNGFSIDEVNQSIIKTEYRAYGLQDKHTTTASFIAVAAFAGMSLIYSKGLKYKLGLYLLTVLVLFVGMGTTAFLLFMALFPVAIALACRTYPFRAIAATVLCTILFFVCIYGISRFDFGFGLLLKNRLDILTSQLHFLFNFAGTYVTTYGGDLNTSFPNIYKTEAMSFRDYLAAHPQVGIVGEGFVSYQKPAFPRGGDVAITELLVTLGAPITLFLFFSIATAILVALRQLLFSKQAACSAAMLSFSIMVILFMLCSLGHYNVLFKKEILPIFTFALALLSRFSSSFISEEAMHSGLKLRT